jgi:uncharacterized protein (DUF885 family)
LHRWSLSFVAAAAISSPAHAEDTAAQRLARQNALIAEDWEHRLRESPEFATFRGDPRHADGWTDYAIGHVARQRDAVAARLQRLLPIDTRGGLPPFRQTAHHGAYVEGWGLYAERLAKEAGQYQDPMSEYGRLSTELLRAIRLVVDTGVHHGRWTREQMVAYFRAHSTEDEPTIQAETDRYIAWPAQALTYKVGEMKLLELRERARSALGDRFDLRAFHDRVLGAGALPLDVLEVRTQSWWGAGRRNEGPSGR